ncbi:MAG: META domain-containing protein [bacterium]
MGENIDDAPWPTSDRVNAPDLEHPLASLTGTRWILGEYHDATGPHVVPDGSRASLEISDGSLHVEAGCNTGRASAHLHADTIEVGALALTRMMCDDEAMEVEAAVTSVLSGNVPYVLAGDVLTLRGAGTTLIYRPEGRS